MKAKRPLFNTNANLAIACLMVFCSQAYASDTNRFPLVRPAVLGPTCAPEARGKVKVTTLGEFEVMEVKIDGLPKNTEFDVFVIQVPNFPFGLSWYQGDMQTNKKGKAYARFVGRFNKETFIVAPDIAPSPQTHSTGILDAVENPATAPIHTYHIGIWFNSPEDAVKAGCPGLVTTFNGDHNAGIQVLNTSTFTDEKGPLLDLGD